MMKTIAVTGTPGTGKTTISKKLAKITGFCYIDVNQLITKYKIYEGYDKKRKTKLVDTKKLNQSLIKEINTIKKSKKYGGIIIDSHLSHYLPKKYITFCIVAKCNIKELSKRMKKKGFHKEKIIENLQAEIFDICLNEAKRMKQRIIILDTAKSFNIRSLAKKLGG
ncbi:MAG: AAA family ATPase [Nanoarchaeota archaeon]